jgi:hypothetical protein
VARYTRHIQQSKIVFSKAHGIRALVLSIHQANMLKAMMTALQNLVFSKEIQQPATRRDVIIWFKEEIIDDGNFSARLWAPFGIEGWDFISSCSLQLLAICLLGMEPLGFSFLLELSSFLPGLLANTAN